MLKFNFIKYFCVIVLLFATIVFAGCQGEKREKTVLALDTVITLTAEGKNSKEALEQSAEFLTKLDNAANFSKDSELSKLNKETPNKFTKVSPEIYDMISLGKYFSDFTNKHYNVALGNLVALWDKAREFEEVPKNTDILKARENVNPENITLQDDKVQKSTADVQATFGGIAKGYAADKVYALYKNKGVEGFMNFGSSTILACGDRTYRVGVKNPRNPDETLGVVTLKDEVLSTSGDYERYFTKDGVRYHHIIDPFTGYPAKSGIASATIIVPLSKENAGAMSDVLSTALVVAGEKGREFLPNGVKALLVTVDGELVRLNGFKLEGDANP